MDDQELKDHLEKLAMLDQMDQKDQQDNVAVKEIMVFQDLLDHQDPLDHQVTKVDYSQHFKAVGHNSLQDRLRKALLMHNSMDNIINIMVKTGTVSNNTVTMVTTVTMDTVITRARRTRLITLIKRRRVSLHLLKRLN